MAAMKRGANVALTREIPGLTGVVLGVRWNAGAEHVLDRQPRGRDHPVRRRQQGALRRALRVLQPADLAGPVGQPARAGARRRQGAGRGRPARRAARRSTGSWSSCTSTTGTAPRRTLGQLRECAVRVLDLRRQPRAGALGEPGAGAAAETGAGAGRAVPAQQRLEVQGHRPGLRQRHRRASPRTTGCRCDCPIPRRGPAASRPAVAPTTHAPSGRRDHGRRSTPEPDSGADASGAAALASSSLDLSTSLDLAHARSPVAACTRVRAVGRRSTWGPVGAGGPDRGAAARAVTGRPHGLCRGPRPAAGRS